MSKAGYTEGAGYNQGYNPGYASPMNSAPMHGVPSGYEPGRIIVGLDVGTTKVCAIVAVVQNNDMMTILGVGHAPVSYTHLTLPTILLV